MDTTSQQLESILRAVLDTIVPEKTTSVPVLLAIITQLHRLSLKMTANLVPREWPVQSKETLILTYLALRVSGVVVA